MVEGLNMDGMPKTDFVELVKAIQMWTRAMKMGKLLLDNYQSITARDIASPKFKESTQRCYDLLYLFTKYFPKDQPTKAMYDACRPIIKWLYPDMEPTLHLPDGYVLPA